jgi:hypothetical protein
MKILIMRHRYRRARLVPAKRQRETAAGRRTAGGRIIEVNIGGAKRLGLGQLRPHTQPHAARWGLGAACAALRRFMLHFAFHGRRLRVRAGWACLPLPLHPLLLQYTTEVITDQVSDQRQRGPEPAAISDKGKGERAERLYIVYLGVTQ